MRLRSRPARAAAIAYRGMAVIGALEEDVRLQGLALPVNLQEPGRAGPLLFQGIDQVEGIHQGLAVDGKQQVPRPQAGALGIGAGDHGLDRQAAARRRGFDHHAERDSPLRQVFVGKVDDKIVGHHG